MFASVNLQTVRARLSEEEYQVMRATCVHDEDIELQGWALYLSLVLQRTIGQDEARRLIEQYNLRLVREYQS